MRVERCELRREDVRRWLEGLGAVLLIGALVSILHFCGARICLFHRLTGLPCLTCGTSRACALLLRGDLAGGFVMQPLFVVAFLMLFAGVLAQTWLMLFRHEVLKIMLERRERLVLSTALIILAAANWAWLIVRGA
ncbi:MAG: DUF2752 domain-containing protein [Kiritimatiellae bacterium]|nr:DUF2752 domain-containing protein [Kiritimatiellia bacterium]